MQVLLYRGVGPNYLLTTYAADNTQGSVYYPVKMSSSQPPKLLDQIRNLVRLRHMSHKTELAYVSYARDYILIHKKRHPREMGVDEIRDYLTHLAVERRVAASTQNVAFNALLFLYKQVLGIELPVIPESGQSASGTHPDLALAIRSAPLPATLKQSTNFPLAPDTNSIRLASVARPRRKRLVLRSGS